MQNKKIISIVLGIMCFLLTLGIFVQIRTVNSTNTTVSQNYEENNLRADVLKYKERYENRYKELEKAEQDEDIILSEEQREAIKAVNDNNVCIITGGPRNR